MTSTNIQEWTGSKRDKACNTSKTLGEPGKVATNTPNADEAKKWLNGLGFETAFYQRMKNETAVRCYNQPRYLKGVMEAKGFATSDIVALLCRVSLAWAEVEFHHEADKANALAEKTNESLSDQPTPVIEGTPAITISDDILEPATPMPTPAPETPANPNDAAAALAHALKLMGMGAQQPPAMDEARIREIIKQEVDTPLRVEIKRDDREPIKIEGLAHEKFPLVLKMLEAGANVLLVGPAGAGKTTLAGQAAKALELEFHFTGAVASEYKLSGFVDAQGRIVSTEFRRAYEQGGLFLFDEVDGSSPSALLAFNATLANGHADFPDGLVERHERFRVIAAANTFGRGADRQYVGRNQLDAASLDRFAVIDFDYDTKLEKALTGNDAWCARVQGYRAAIASQKVRHVVSPRASILGAKLLAAGIDQNDVENACIWKGLDTDTRRKIENAI